MTTQIEAMKIALEALENTYSLREDVIKAKLVLKQAIEAAEKVEPDAVVVDLQSCFPSCAVVPVFPVGTEFYLHPPSAEIEELRKDAARYRWLKKHKFRWNGHCWHSQFGDVLRHTDIDAAIDAAMEEQP